jgi:serine/threonine protein kinase
MLRDDDNPDQWAKSMLGYIIQPKYQLDSLLGMGGMGAVFAAHHVQTKARVAIKVIRPERLSERDSERFRRETARTAQLHRNVVQVLDFGEDPQLGPFLVMEHLQGESLQEHLDRVGTLSPTDVQRIFCAVLEALQDAHDLGVIHRDLKPANVFLCPVVGSYPAVRVLDFGASYARGIEDYTLTNEGAVMGTPRYMAPEQARGNRVGSQADIYSIGAMIYTCLSGKPPYAEWSGPSVFAALLSGPPKPLMELVPQLPAVWIHLVNRAMDPEPELRFASAHAFRQALQQPEKYVKSNGSKGNKRVLGILLAGVLVVVLVAVGLGMRGRFQQERPIRAAAVSSANLNLPWGRELYQAQQAWEQHNEHQTQQYIREILRHDNAQIRKGSVEASQLGEAYLLQLKVYKRQLDELVLPSSSREDEAFFFKRGQFVLKQAHDTTSQIIIKGHAELNQCAFLYEGDVGVVWAERVIVLKTIKEPRVEAIQVLGVAAEHYRTANTVFAKRCFKEAKVSHTKALRRLKEWKSSKIAKP